MLFQTWEFVIFFAVVMAGMALLRPGLKSLWLLAASYFFYGYMSPAFLVFIIYITIVDYFIGRGLAAYSTDVTLKDIARLCDVFYIGGTKVGALFGEAVVVTRTDLLPHFLPLVKQHGALLAKGRLLGVQFETLFSEDLYLRISRNAIDKAMKLKDGFLSKGYRPYIDSPTNQQFFWLPDEMIDRLMQTATFELWGPRRGKETPARFVTDWATRDEEISELTARL